MKKIKTILNLLTIFLFCSLFTFSFTTFIPSADRTDMVHDEKRDILYISTSTGFVERYNLKNNSFLSPYNVGGSLRGLDISPDNNTLIVSDITAYAPKTYGNNTDDAWLHKINLETEQVSKIHYMPESYEAGAWSVAYDKNGDVFFTTNYRGSGSTPLRKYNADTNTIDIVINRIRNRSMIKSSADGSTVAFEESDTSSGAFGKYDVILNEIQRAQGYDHGTSWYNYEIGVSRNGSQLAIPTYGGTFIADADLNIINILGTYAGGQGIGAVYHPFDDILYLPWAESSYIRAYDTNSFELLDEFYFNHFFDHHGNWAYQEGRLKMSQDGEILFSSVDGGIRYQKVWVTPVPEPTTILLFGLGLLGFFKFNRKT